MGTLHTIDCHKTTCVLIRVNLRPPLHPAVELVAGHQAEVIRLPFLDEEFSVRRSDRRRVFLGGKLECVQEVKRLKEIPR
jgi:hypothetical protein